MKIDLLVIFLKTTKITEFKTMEISRATRNVKSLEKTDGGNIRNLMKLKVK